MLFVVLSFHKWGEGDFMALPLLERYSLSQAINFIKNRTGEQLIKEDLLEYAITGSLKIGIQLEASGGILRKIGSKNCQNMRLRNFDSPILHTKDYPMWANPKSFLHKELCRFIDGYMNIDINLPFKRTQTNHLSIQDHIEKLSCEDEKQVMAYIEELKSKDFEQIKEEVKLETRSTENDEQYELISWIQHGELSFKGFSYLEPIILNKLKPFVQKNEDLAIYDFDRFMFESVDFENSKIKSFLSFEIDLEDLDLTTDEEYEQAALNKISINDLIIFKNDLLKFIGESEKDLNLSHSLYLLGEVLNTVKSKTKKWTQSAIIDEILTQRQEKQISGLEQRKIEEYFSTANKLFKAK